MLTVAIKGIESPFVVDTGCLRTTVSLNFVKKWDAEHLMQSVNYHPILGIIPLTFSFSEDVHIRLHVQVQDIPWNLLGCDFFIASHSLIDLHPSYPTLTIRRKENSPIVNPVMPRYPCIVGGKKTIIVPDTGSTGFLTCSSLVAEQLDIPFKKKIGFSFINSPTGLYKIIKEAKNVEVKGFGSTKLGTVAVE